MHFVNDMLDFSNIKNKKYEQKLSKFDPNLTFKSIIELFSNQPSYKDIYLEHKVRRFLDSPCSQGKREEPLVENYDDSVD